MSEPAAIADALYRQDFIGWTEQQARALREAAARGANLPLDWENLIEEVEGLGRSQHDAVASHVRRVIMHLLKLTFSPASEPRLGWIRTVRQARSEIDAKLGTDPGLRPRLADIILREWPRAAKLAIEDMADHGEDVSLLTASARAEPFLEQEKLLGDWLPERPGQT